MDRRRITYLERKVRMKTGKYGSPPPGFFKQGDPAIDSYHEDLLKQGYFLEQVTKTPIFIE